MLFVPFVVDVDVVDVVPDAYDVALSDAVAIDLQPALLALNAYFPALLLHTMPF